MTKEAKKVEIQIEPMNLKKMKVQVKGISPLIMDRFTDEAQKQILAKQTGVAKSAKKALRDTGAETRNAVHITNDDDIGFPAFGFKKGMMECTSFVGDKFFSKKLVSGAVKIINVVDGLIPIKYKKQSVLKHNIGNVIKFSPQFHDWNCELEIVFDANNISHADIVTLINYAGFYIGVGSWRPKGKDGGSGEYGTYEVKKAEMKKESDKK